VRPAATYTSFSAARNSVRCTAFTPVTPTTTVASVQVKTATPKRVRRVSIASRNSVKWIAFTTVLGAASGSSVNTGSGPHT
jgi:hypothetical protein